MNDRETILRAAALGSTRAGSPGVVRRRWPLLLLAVILFLAGCDNFNFYATLDGTTEKTVLTSGVDYTIAVTNFPATGSTASLLSGALKNVSFSSTWPQTYGTYYLIVVISAADDENTGNDSAHSGPIPVGLGDGGEAAEVEPNGAWDPNNGDFGWGWAAEANDFGIALQPGMTVTITGAIETDGADIFKLNTGSASEISVSVTWNGDNIIDAPLHDASGPELEGIYADKGFEAYTYSAVSADGYGYSDLYITIGNDAIWNGLPGNNTAYTLTIQGL